MTAGSQGVFVSAPPWPWTVARILTSSPTSTMKTGSSFSTTCRQGGWLTHALRLHSFATIPLPTHDGRHGRSSVTSWRKDSTRYCTLGLGAAAGHARILDLFPRGAPEFPSRRSPRAHATHILYSAPYAAPCRARSNALKLPLDLYERYFSYASRPGGLEPSLSAIPRAIHQRSAAEMNFDANAAGQYRENSAPPRRGGGERHGRAGHDPAVRHAERIVGARQYPPPQLGRPRLWGTRHEAVEVLTFEVSTRSWPPE